MLPYLTYQSKEWWGEANCAPFPDGGVIHMPRVLRNLPEAGFLIVNDTTSTTNL